MTTATTTAAPGRRKLPRICPSSLILLAPTNRKPERSTRQGEDDYPWGLRPDGLDQFVDSLNESSGPSEAVEMVAASRSADECLRAWYARSARVGVGPDQIAEILRASFEADLRPLLPFISCPALVLHRERNGFIQVGAGRYLAEHIPDARLVILPGTEQPSFAGTRTP